MLLFVKIIISLIAPKWVSGQLQQYPQYRSYDSRLSLRAPPSGLSQPVMPPNPPRSSLDPFKGIARLANTLRRLENYPTYLSNNPYRTDSDHGLNQYSVTDLTIKNPMERPSLRISAGICKIVSGPAQRCSDRISSNVTILIEPDPNRLYKRRRRYLNSLDNLSDGVGLHFNCRTFVDLRSCIADNNEVVEDKGRNKHKSDNTMIVNFIVSDTGKLLHPQQEVVFSENDVVDITIITSSTSKVPPLINRRSDASKKVQPKTSPPRLRIYDGRARNTLRFISDILDRIFDHKEEQIMTTPSGFYGNMYFTLGRSKTRTTTSQPPPAMLRSARSPITPNMEYVTPSSTNSLFRTPSLDIYGTTTSEPPNKTTSGATAPEQTLDDAVTDSEIEFRIAREDESGTSESQLPKSTNTEGNFNPMEAVNLKSELLHKRIVLRKRSSQKPTETHFRKDKKQQRKRIVAEAL